jgi:hypothetical protein
VARKKRPHSVALGGGCVGGVGKEGEVGEEECREDREEEGCGGLHREKYTEVVSECRMT